VEHADDANGLHELEQLGAQERRPVTPGLERTAQQLRWQ